MTCFFCKQISKASLNFQMAPSTKPSESHHSLGNGITSDERLQKEVQRTTSMSSENHSEAFFSAEEDILNSRSSSLRNSILSSGGTLIRQDSNSVPSQRFFLFFFFSKIVLNSIFCRKKFSSELSIVADRPYKTIGPIHAPGSAPEATRLRLSTHRSDHEIHTPEHRSFVSNHARQVC